MPGRPRASDEPYETLIFEIARWEPNYAFGVNRMPLHRGPYDEHFAVDLVGTCIHPAKYEGRTVDFNIVGRRDLPPAEPENGFSGWRPNCVGPLTLRPGGTGQFLTSVPHDTIAHLVFALTHGLYRYAVLHGPALKRGKALTQSIGFQKTVNLEDY